MINFKFKKTLFWVFIMISFFWTQFSIFSVYADLNIGGKALYNERSDGAKMYLYDLDNNSNIKLNIDGNARYVYKDYGIIYTRYNQLNNSNNTYYKGFYSALEKQILPTNGNLIYFNKENGDFIYQISEYSNNTRNYYYYKKNIFNDYYNTLILSGINTRIQSISPDLTKIIYQNYNSINGINKVFLKNISTGEEIYLGVSRIQTDTSYTNYDYRFFGSNNELLENHYIYSYTNNSSSRNFSLINISDFNNFTYSNLGLNLGDNGWVLGRKGTDIYYQTQDNIDWTNHIFLKRGSDVTEIFSGNYGILTDWQNSTILGYGDYIFYQYRDNNTNKNIIGYKNTVTGEDGILFHGNISPDTLYIRAKNTSEDSGFCSGDILTCGQSIENFSQIGGLIYKNYSNKIGFIGTNYQENSQINEFSGNIGYLGNNNTYGTGTSSNFAGSLGYIGNNNTYGSGTNNELAGNIGYIGNSYNYSTGENTLLGNIGFIGNNYTNIFSNISTNSNIIGYFGQKDIIPEGKQFTFDAQVGLLLGAGNKLVSPKIEKFVYDIKNLKLNKSSTTPIKTNLALTQNQKKNTILKDMLDPVDPSTGEFTYDNTLMSLPGIGLPYELSVSYKSMSYSNGYLGINWDHNYNIKLVESLNGTYNYIDGTMSSKTLLAMSGSFIDDIETQIKGLDASLIKYSDGSGYKISFKNKKSYLFNSTGYISEIKDANGNKLSFVYDANNLLVQVIDTLGKTINYTYNNDNKLVKVTESGGRYVAFEYFSGNTDYGDENDLKSIKIHNSDTAEKTISFSYYLSGNDFNLSHNMKSLIDSKGHVYVVNTYDNNDRVISQSYGDGIGYYEYTLGNIHSDDTPEQVGNGEVVGTYVVKNKVTDKKGNVTEYTYNRMGNVLSRKVLDVNGNEKNLVSYEYDSIGHMTKEIEARGNGIEYKYDENGNKIEERKKQDINLADDDSSDIITKYEFDLDTNLLTKIIIPDSTETEFTYNSSNNLIKSETKNVVLGSDSPTISLITENTYNELGELIKQVNPEGNETSFEYLSGQLVKTVKGNLFNKIEESYTYDNYGNLVSKTDGNGNIQTLSYDELNRLTETTTAEGIKKQYTYDANDNKEFEKQILEGGNSIETRYDYNLLDKATSIFTYIDSNTRVGLLNIYDKNENISETIYPNGLKKQYVYDENENLVEEKIISTEVTDTILNKYTYDINGNKIQSMDSKGNSVYFEYDLFDRTIKTTDSLGNYTSYIYDKLGNIIKTESFNSTGKRLKSKEFTYNSIGKVLSEKTLDLDIDGNLKITDTQDILKKYEYNKNGQVIKTIDSKGIAIDFSYDIFGRLTDTTDSIGNKIKNIYDKNNNIISKEILENNGKSTITSYLYDKDNRLVSETNNLNKTKTYTYNSLNQVVSTIDENGNTINYTYEYRGKVLSETKYLNGNPLITSYVYDISGNLIKLTDTNGNVTNYEYDSLGRLVKQIYPNGQISTKTYDTNNNVLTTTDPNGTLVTNTYDSLNRLTSRNIQTGAGVEGVTSETYSYDDAGRLKESNDSNNNLLSFEYDSKDNLVKEIQNGSIVETTYDQNNNLLNQKLDNKQINYTYDNLNRLTSIGKGSQNIADYTYSGLENTSISYANTKQINQSFDELNRLASLDNGVKTFSYTYDNVNNIISDNNKNFTYDSIYRLNQVNKLADLTNLESFTYDNMGNRLNSSLNQTGTIDSINYTTNTLNQYTEIAGTTNSGTLIYDNNGNLIENSKYRFTYDYKNRLVKVIQKSYIVTTENTGATIPETPAIPPETNTGTVLSDSGTTLTDSGIILTDSGSLIDTGTVLTDSGIVLTDSGSLTDSGTTTDSGAVIPPETPVITTTTETIPEKLVAKYTYDVLGRRIAKETESSIIKYIYSGEKLLIEKELINGVAKTKEYVYGDKGVDDVIAVIIDGTSYYYHKDHLGSIVGITDSSGNLVSTYEYDSFGNFQISGTDIGNDRLFTGREYDRETGLYYYRARYYDSNLGRFISRDTIDVSDNVNLYTYVGNNPVMFSDPSGLKAKRAIIGGLYLSAEFILDNTLGIQTATAEDGENEYHEYDFANEIGLDGETLQNAGYIGTAVGVGIAGYSMYKSLKKGNVQNFFNNTKYTDKVLEQMGKDLNHGFPVKIDDIAIRNGKVEKIIGGDNKEYYKLTLPGTVNGKRGVFEYIKDSSGNINHRFFNSRK